MTSPVTRRAVAVAWAIALAGCKPSADGNTPAEPANPKQVVAPRGGIKIPLPPGWSAHATAEEALAAGPPGKIVLQIDLVSGGAKELPAPKELISRFEASARELAVKTIDSQSEEDRSLAVLQVSPRGDGGTGSAWIALLGAKRLGNDLFLCATLPGAGEEEVKAASAACGGMSRTEAK